jgi:predicted PurR-regulated permease PerM
MEIFIVIIVAGSLGGPIGMIFAIPVYTIFRIVVKEFLSELEVIRNLTKDI